jgi:hypothetical protein
MRLDACTNAFDRVATSTIHNGVLRPYEKMVKLAKESVVGFISVTGTVIFLAIMDCSSATSKCSAYNYELFLALASAEAVVGLFVAVKMFQARSVGIEADWQAKNGGQRRCCVLLLDGVASPCFLCVTPLFSAVR